MSIPAPVVIPASVPPCPETGPVLDVGTMGGSIRLELKVPLALTNVEIEGPTSTKKSRLRIVRLY